MRKQFLNIVLAIVSGLLTAVSFSPNDWWFLVPLTLGCFFYCIAHIEKIRGVFITGFMYGVVFFICGLWWIYFALSGHIGFHPILAFFLTLLFCSFLGLFPAFAVTAACYICRHPSRRFFALAACFVLAEWLRGWMFSGFPWLTIGYSQIPYFPFSSWAPFLGIYGVSFALLLSVSSVLFIITTRGRIRVRLYAIIGIMLLIATPQIFSTWSQTTPTEKIQVALLQGNVKQSLKWDKERMERALADYMNMTENDSTAQLIIMPESALAMIVKNLPENYFKRLQQSAHKREGAVIAGAFIEENNVFYNAAIVLTDETIKDYRKTHITPYGEYLPLPRFIKRWLRTEGIRFSELTPGKNNVAMHLFDGIYGGISICYEDVFGNEWREQLPRAHFLINMTNDAWFDKTIMPMQHLQISQARALEMGRWLVRATNTGMTAIIDEQGRITSMLPKKIKGVLTGEIQLHEGITPYVRMGDSAIVILALFVLLMSWIRRILPIDD